MGNGDKFKKFLAIQAKNWWFMPLNFDAASFYEEIKMIDKKNFFVSPRSKDGLWKQVLLRTFDEDFKGHFWSLGYDSPEQLSWNWTSLACEHCPEIVKWVTSMESWAHIYRVSVSLLEPGGTIERHHDDYPGIEGALNCCIYAKESEILFDSGSVLTMSPGDVVQLNLLKMHSVKNFTDVNRWHLIVMLSPKNLDEYTSMMTRLSANHE